MDDIDVRGLLDVIEAQQRSIERLVSLLERREQEAKRQDDEAPPAPKPRPVDWSRLTGRERLLTWQGLAVFVEGLVYRYNLQLTVRACWWRHGNVIDELTALWQIQQASFGEDADLRSPQSWQRSIEDSVDRVRLMQQSCGTEHVDVTMPTWMTDQNRREFVAAVKADVIAHTPRD